MSKDTVPSGNKRELLSWLKTRLPLHCDILLSGDCEFGAVELLRQLDAWGWNFVKGSTHICFADPSPWQDFASIIAKAGQSLWMGLGYLAESAIYSTHLVAHWKQGEDELCPRSFIPINPRGGFARRVACFERYLRNPQWLTALRRSQGSS